jgi:hypothetical protein
MIRPCGSLCAGGSQHPFAEFIYQAGILRNRDEFGRRDHAPIRMAPAQQGFAAGHLVVAKIDNGLVMDFESAAQERQTQILLHGKPGLRSSIHARLEESIGSTSIGLSTIHRQIGILDELIQISAVPWS